MHTADSSFSQKPQGQTETYHMQTVNQVAADWKLHNLFLIQLNYSHKIEEKKYFLTKLHSFSRL